MIKRKIVFVVEGGIEFDTEDSAEKYVRDKKVKDDLITFISGKDLTDSKVDAISEFITENAKELYVILSPMFEEM